MFTVFGKLVIKDISTKTTGQINTVNRLYRKCVLQHTQNNNTYNDRIFILIMANEVFVQQRNINKNSIIFKYFCSKTNKNTSLYIYIF